MKKATPNRFLTAGRPGVFKVKMSLGRAMKTTDLNGGLTGGVGTLGPASAFPAPVFVSGGGRGTHCHNSYCKGVRTEILFLDVIAVKIHS